MQISVFLFALPYSEFVCKLLPKRYIFCLSWLTLIKVVISVKTHFFNIANQFFIITIIPPMKNTLIAALFCLLSNAEKSSYYGDSYEPVVLRKFPTADLDSLFRSSGRFKAAKRAQFGAIQYAEDQIQTPTRSIDSLFLRLPSSFELDQLIQSADSVAILRSIQTVATDDSIPCDQRIAYLLQILGRIRGAIAKKQFHAHQIEVIIQQALDEIKRLEDEIKRLEDEKKALWLDELRDKLAKLIKELEEVYRQFNAIQAKIPPKEAFIAGYEKEIRLLTKSNDAERNRIAQDKLKLTQTQAILRDLENQLKAAKNRKEALEASISKSEAIIAENDKRVAEARAKIAKLEEEIRQLRDKADALRGKYTALEIKVERLRTEISVAEAKEDAINAQIDNNINRINFEKKKIAQDELDDLNRMIAALKELVPTVETEIDRHYYYCYGEGSVEVQKTGSVTVYIVRGQNFGAYLQNAYGKSVKIPALRGDIHFHKVDIFAAPWTSKYGIPFVNTSLEGRDLAFGGDFSCLSPSKAVKGYGTIAEVTASQICVDNSDGKRIHLDLGACSRLQSKTELPRVGQNFYWAGIPAEEGDGRYKLYRGSCF